MPAFSSCLLLPLRKNFFANKRRRWQQKCVRKTVCGRSLLRACFRKGMSAAFFICPRMVPATLRAGFLTCGPRNEAVRAFSNFRSMAYAQRLTAYSNGCCTGFSPVSIKRGHPFSVLGKPFLQHTILRPPLSTPARHGPRRPENRAAGAVLPWEEKKNEKKAVNPMGRGGCPALYRQ